MLKTRLYVTLTTLFACWIVLGVLHYTTHADDPPPMAEPFPTLSSSASAGRFSCSASTTPGIGNVDFGDEGDGWTGTGNARADVMGDTDKNLNQHIQAVIKEITFVWHGLEVTEKYVESTDVSESNHGMPWSDKWASSDGCYGGLDSSDYCDYDSSLW